MRTSTIPELLKPKRVADILGVTEETLTVWRCTGRYELPYVKCGRLIMYNAKAIEEFIERRTRGQKVDRA